MDREALNEQLSRLVEIGKKKKGTLELSDVLDFFSKRQAADEEKE